MKFSAEAKQINKALQCISAAIPSRPAHPILSTVKIHALIKGEIVFEGCNLSMAIKTTIFADVYSDDKEYCFPYKLLKEMVASFNGDETVTIEVVGHQATIEGNLGRYKLAVHDTTQFPVMNKSEGGSFTVDTDEVTKAFYQVEHAASKDETKQVLTGVCFTPKEEGTEVAATNGHFLALTQICTNEIQDFDKLFVVPTALVNSKALKFFECENITFSGLGTEVISIEGDDTTIISRLNEGAYPHYRQLIPQEFETEVCVDRKDFINALKFVQTISKESNNVVKVKFKDGQLYVLAEGADVGGAKTSFLFSGESKLDEIGFNCSYMISALQHIPGEIITLKINTASSPMILESGTNLTLVMPVQIRE